MEVLVVQQEGSRQWRQHQRPVGAECGLAGVVVLALSGVASLAGPAAADGGTNGIPEYRRIVFPVQEPVTYVDSFGACRLIRGRCVPKSPAGILSTIFTV